MDNIVDFMWNGNVVVLIYVESICGEIHRDYVVGHGLLLVFFIFIILLSDINVRLYLIVEIGFADQKMIIGFILDRGAAKVSSRVVGISIAWVLRLSVCYLWFISHWTTSYSTRTKRLVATALVSRVWSHRYRTISKRIASAKENLRINTVSYIWI